MPVVTERRHVPPRRPSAVLFAVWLALSALVFNGVALAAHHHPVRRAGIARSIEQPVAATGEDACALCSAAGISEPYLPAQALGFVAALPAATPTAVAAVANEAPFARAHIWRSRAPPVEAAT